MTYGDGAGNAAPLVELDVAGHEMSHGVTENTAGLTYSGEAGGLNEATSDIFGTAVEWYANNATDTPDYLIGEEININGNGTPLRYMDKPSKDGALEGLLEHHPRRPGPALLVRPAQPLVLHASEGSGAKTINGVSYNSPTCDGRRVTGISHLKAEKIWYRTLVDLPHLVEQLRRGPHRRDQGGQGPLRRRLGRVHRGREGLGAPSPSRRAPRPVARRRRRHGWRADERRLRVRPDRLDRHCRPDHEQHGSSGPRRLVEAVARWQRLHGLRERVADLRRPVHGHLADPDLLDPDRHGRDDDDHRLRHGHGADQRRHEAELLEPVHAEGVVRPEDDRPHVLQGHERHAEVRRQRGLLAPDELRHRRRRDELLSATRARRAA